MIMSLSELDLCSESDEDTRESLVASISLAPLYEPISEKSTAESQSLGFDYSGDASGKEKANPASQSLEKLQREKKNLSLTTKELADFDPELSQRERRKLNSRLNSDKGRPLQGHNENGFINGTDKDLCDCLSEECPGCHLPCWTCRSCKCGFECRNNRKYIIESTEDQDGKVTVNPVLKRN